MRPLLTAMATSAAGTPPFFAEVTALLVTTALVAYLGQRLGVMPIVSFLLAGALIGPHALGLVQDEALIEAAAEVGVILLLFTIGIEFSLGKLARIKRIIVIGGGLQVAATIAGVSGLLALLGVDWRSGVFTGCLVALSSTAIVMKLLSARGEMDTSEGRGSLGILIFQDLAVVGMILLIPILGGAATSGGAVAIALGKAVAIVALVLVVARRVMPRVLEAVARTCSQEIFLLSVVAICFGTAYLTSLAGVSLSLGAFLAGLVVSESRFSQLAFAEILPLQILFSASFFLSVGLLFDPRFLAGNVLVVLGLIAAVLLVKLATTGIGLLALGYRVGSAGVAALLLAQIGEFSFVLERAGREVGLVPAGRVDGGPEAFIATTVALMLVTPFVYPWAEGRLRSVRSSSSSVRGGPASAATTSAHGAHGPPRDHVVIAGLGEVGSRLSHALDARGVPNVVLTLSPDSAAEAEGRGTRVIRGNYARQHEMELAGLRTARVLVVADDDMNTTLQVVETARALHPNLLVIARTRQGGDPMTLREAGATEVVTDHDAVADRVRARVLAAYKVEDDVAPDSAAGRVDGDGLQPATLELTPDQQSNPVCGHAGQTGAVSPSAAGCETCLAQGKRAWVHLRICMTCGYVGCCDSSPGRHSTKHHQASGHPIVRSMEPGEDWAWCYEDRAYL